MVADYSQHSRPLVSEASVQNDLIAGEGISAKDNLSGSIWHGEIDAALDNLKQVETQARGQGTLSAEVSLSSGLSEKFTVNHDLRPLVKESASSDKIENRLYPPTKEENIIDCQWGRRLNFSEEIARKAQWEEQRRRLLELDLTPYMWNHSSP